MKATRMARGKEPITDSRQKIAQAAIECFAKFGVHRASMADVAKAAGISRQTVYRVFASRTELLTYIATGRIAAMAERLSSYFQSVESLEEALVDGSLLSVDESLGDALLTEITEQSGDHGFEKFLFRGSPEIDNLMNSLWGPLLDRAREEGILRPQITNDEAMDWIKDIHAMLSTARTDYSPDDRRRVLATFLVPSLLIDQRVSRG